MGRLSAPLFPSGLLKAAKALVVLLGRYKRSSLFPAHSQLLPPGANLGSGNAPGPAEDLRTWRWATGKSISDPGMKSMRYLAGAAADAEFCTVLRGRDVASSVEKAESLGARVLIRPTKLPKRDEVAVLYDVHGMSFASCRRS